MHLIVWAVKIRGERKGVREWKEHWILNPSWFYLSD